MKSVVNMSNVIVGKASAFYIKARSRGWEYVTDVILYFIRRLLYFSLIFRLSKKLGPGSSLSGRVESLKEYLHGRSLPSFHFSSAEIERIVLAIPDNTKMRVIGNANRALESQFNFRNICDWTFPGAIDWTFMPGGNVSWNWELNRHSFFLDLGRSYYYTNDPVYMNSLLKVWEEWVKSNRPGRCLTWRHPFEVASRLNNWIWAFFFVVYSRMASDAQLKVLLDSIYEHAHYLYWNLEYHWPNNHLLMEAKVLLSYSILFPEMDSKQRFFRRSLSVFERAVRSQVLHDGCHSELCTMYHRLIAGELLELLMVAEKNTVVLSIDLREQVMKMFRLTRAMTRPDGSMPLIGDSALEDSNIRFDPLRADTSDLTQWLFPRSDIPYWLKHRRSGNASLELFSEAGYAFVEAGEEEERVHISFDYGEFTKNPVPDHGHCDALSFELYSGGRALIIDPGIYYPANHAGEWRSYFRSTAAHNTLLIDGREQSELWRLSHVRARAKTILEYSSLSDTCVTMQASCSPYWIKNNTLLHSREIDFQLASRKMCICDSIDGEGMHNMKWLFHFGFGIDAIADGDQTITAYSTCGEALFTLRFIGDAIPKVSLIRGSLDPYCGWASVNSSEVLPIYSVVYEIDVTLPFRARVIVELPGHRTSSGRYQDA